ncbi:DUF2187 family protein [Bacillus sp. V5-8f]|uniref:DUF2187 family protein n=1 Tax=Bacillus sp. V5-8f TaxID=2053044 RepID=UPI000C75FA44|nr:DUF2187 family protein [Bacillus sp. V5-8f]PLT33133.1 DUF2187 domain-containing protein [Bacillus sp. V5-8f]
MAQQLQAKIGDEIIFKQAVRGVIEKVNMNSVIVRIISNPTDFEFLSERTVVNHKNYQVVSENFLGKSSSNGIRMMQELLIYFN